MNRRYLFIFAAILLVSPIIAAAAGLVPCGDAGEPACQACYFVTLMNKVIAWLIAILGVLMSILIVVSGLQLVTSGGDVSAKETAKKRIVNGAVGFMIVLATWLLVDFGMKALLSPSSPVFGTWNTIQCTILPGTWLAGGAGMAGGGTLSQACDPATTPATYDCSAQVSACVDGGGTTTPAVPTSATASITCTYPPPPSTSTCTLPTSGACAPSNMSGFDPRQDDAATICLKESGGAPILSGVDICCGTDGSCSGDPAFSGGYFQINVLAHANKIPGCTGTFFAPNGSATLQGDCMQRNSQGMCTGWTCSITNPSIFNTCMSVTNDTSLNFSIALQLYHAAGDTFRDWSWSSRQCSII